MRMVLLLFVALLHGYTDPELDMLWASIPDIYHPRAEDFLQIESYIAEGARPYLEPLRKAVKDPAKMARLNRICSFKFLGPNREMPIFEVHRLNECEETNQRCILIFGSHNTKVKSYATFARRAVQDLEQIGYSGHVLLRLGGFPNLERGSLRYCYVPYAFKVAFFDEARSLGYKEILWVDSEIYPLRDLEMIFAEVKKNGYFFISPGSLEASGSYFPEEIAAKMQIWRSLYAQIPHIQSGVLGLNMEDPRANQLLDLWLAKTEEVHPNVTFFPEELSLSYAAWKVGFKPTFPSGEIICIYDEIFRSNLLRARPVIQFCFRDPIRD